jgi:NAD(P)-dependent dehydrogenase (short-subunit alcohol dehydrogenase family)
MTEISFDGAVAVVTGGAGGIGRALVARLVNEGARVAVVDLDAGAAQAAASQLGAVLGIGTDVGDEAAVTAMVGRVEEEIGPIDMYFSNAGVLTGEGLGDDRAWDIGWKVHGLAHVYAARTALADMAARGSGVFVVTASAAGLLMTTQSAPYTVTKHASVAITEWLAVNYGDSGVQFHCLCPQGVRTPMLEGDASGTRSEVAVSGPIMDPADVVDTVFQAIRDNRFLVLPHPEVKGYEQRKVDDRDRWLGGMRRLLARVTG